MAILAALVGCNGAPGAQGPAAGGPGQQACECTCPSATAPLSPAPTAAGPGLGVPSPVAGAGGVAELMSSASRKMFHEDGAGCLADLDRVRALDPSLDNQTVFLRAQCEMLTGACQRGKAAISAWFQREQAMSPERANQIAESMAGLRCRGGDSTSVDQLRVAYQDLMTGAHIDPKDARFCRDRLDTVVRLAPTVGSGDDQLEGSRKALFHTAASCFAKAGDCAAAYAAYRDHFPADGMKSLPAAEVERVIRTSFDTSIKECATKP